MIKKIDGNKVVLSPQALYVIDKNKTSDWNYLFSVGANGILLSIPFILALR
jgi:hypothetical protein